MPPIVYAALLYIDSMDFRIRTMMIARSRNDRSFAQRLADDIRWWFVTNRNNGRA